MLRIGLFCASGMSTSILIKKLEEAAQKRGMDIKVNAYPESEMVSLLDEVDVALLGPQVRFFLKKAQGICETKNIPVDVIPSADYGMMNGERILDFTLKLVGGKDGE